MKFDRAAETFREKYCVAGITKSSNLNCDNAAVHSFGGKQMNSMYSHNQNFTDTPLLYLFALLEIECVAYARNLSSTLIPFLSFSSFV